VREGKIQLWVDTQIMPGDLWRAQIKEALTSAQVAVLLVSVNFLASEFVANEELPVLLEAARERGLVILSVIVTPCLLSHSKLNQFQFVNNPIKPLSLMSPAEQDVVWMKVTRLVLEVSNRHVPDPPSPDPPRPPDPPAKRSQMVIVLNLLNMILGLLAFLAVIVATVVGKIAPNQLASTNTLGFSAYYLSLLICCSELYVLAVYRQWLWLVGLLVVGAGVYLFNLFSIFGGSIYFVATGVPLVFSFGWICISRRIIAIKPRDHYL